MTNDQQAAHEYQKREGSIKQFHQHVLSALPFPEGGKIGQEPRYAFRKMLLKSLKDRRYDGEIEFLQYEWGKDYIDYLTNNYRDRIWDHFGLGVEKCEEVAEPLLVLAERIKKCVNHLITKRGGRRSILLGWAVLHEYEDSGGRYPYDPYDS